MENLKAQIIDLAKHQEKSGIPLIDNLISDATDQSRMATEAELAEIQRLSQRLQEAA